MPHAATEAAARADAAHATALEAGMRTCYYEVLGCSRTAGGDEIKKVRYNQQHSVTLSHSGLSPETS